MRKFVRFAFILLLGRFILGADPTYTRLFFTPTAFTLRAGEGYFSVYEVIFPSLTVGLTGFADIAGGVSMAPGASDQFFYLAPKLKFFHQGNFAVAAGAIYTAPLKEFSGGGGFVYGVFTVGNRNSSFTFGLAWPFIKTDISDKSVILLGGSLPLSRNLKFITENYIFPGGSSLLSGGFRFYTGKLSVDFALAYPTGQHGGFPFIPWLGFSYKFRL